MTKGTPQLSMTLVTALALTTVLFALAPALATTATTQQGIPNDRLAADISSAAACSIQAALRDVTAKIVNVNPARATFSNASTTCSYKVGLASYTIHGKFSNQTLFDATTAIIRHGQRLMLQVTDPCSGQLDAFLGNPSTDGVTWGGRLLAGRLFQRPCPSPTSTPTATPTVATPTETVATPTTTVATPTTTVATPTTTVATPTATVVQRNQVGPTGPQGAVGPTGPAGPEGPQVLGGFISNDQSSPFLQGIDLQYHNLSGFALLDINLFAAKLSGTNLTNANLTNAYLYTADLAGANLTNTNLTNTNLQGVTGGTTAAVTSAIWNNTLCPDGTNSNNNSNTCVGHGF